MSPIKNFTDSIQPRFPRLGKLKKGGEKINGQYGPDLDHFRFTSDREEIVEAFRNAYGEAPRSIQVYLPYATPQEAFSTWCEIWNASGLVHRCDGETMTIWLENGKYVRGSKPCPGGHEGNDPLNDAVGRLEMIIPELVEAGYVGYVTLETHAKNDILGILAVLEKVYESRAGNPLGLRGILFNLRRVQESISVPGWGERKGQRSRTNKWLVKLEPAADWVRLQLEMAHAAQMGELPAGNVPALGPGEEVLEGQAQEPPGGNGSKPGEQKEPAKGETAQPDVAGEINALGEKLWPGCWGEKKKTIADNFTRDGKCDPNLVLRFLRKRMGEITKTDGFQYHVAKSWPGFEIFMDEIVKDQGESFNRLTALQGIADAARAKAENPNLENVDLLNVILAAFPIKEEK